MEKYFFTYDGRIPNSRYPLLVYRQVLDQRNETAARWLESKFAENDWSNSWRNGVYPFHHYHSITHEVLGVYSGTATLHLGGEQGEMVEVSAGDVIVIPAGVGHKSLDSNGDFGVVGAYPQGRGCDLLRGESGERPQADKNITRLPVPPTDPVFGKSGGLIDVWVDSK